MFLISLTTYGCKTTGKGTLPRPDWIPQDVFFEDDPDDKDKITTINFNEDSVFEEIYVTLIGLDLSWSSAVRDVCKQAGLSVIVHQEQKELKCDLQFNNIHIESALNQLVSLIPEFSFHKDGDTIIFSKSVVQSVGVVNPKYANIVDLTTTIQQIVGQDSTVSNVNGLIVIGGSNRSVEQARLISDLVGIDKPKSWFIDVCILSMSKNWKIDIGIDGSIGGVIKSSSEESILDYVLDGLWSIDYGGGIDEIILRTGVVVLEGTTSRIISVEEIPIPIKTISPQGTVTTTGYETINAGITITIEITKVPDGLRVKLHPEISDISGYIEEKPIVSRKSIESNVIIQNNDKIIISGLWSDRKSSKVSAILDLGSASSATEWIVCARFRKIN